MIPDIYREQFAPYLELFPELATEKDILPFLQALEQRVKSLGVKLRRDQSRGDAKRSALPSVNAHEAWVRLLEKHAEGTIPHLAFKHGAATQRMAPSGALCAYHVRRGKVSLWRISGFDEHAKPLRAEDLHTLTRKVPEVTHYAPAADVANALLAEVPDNFPKHGSENGTDVFRGALFIEIANAHLRELEDTHKRMPLGMEEDRHYNEIRRVRTVLSNQYAQYNAAVEAVAGEAIEVDARRVATYELTI